MKMQGMCLICEMRLGSHRCRVCGRIVCEKCYDAATAMCVACRQGKKLN